MSLVKKTLKEISAKNVNNKKERNNKPIEIHTIYKDLIKKNNIFNDLKELNSETNKFTPHFYFHLNDNLNNYLTKLKKINDWKGKKFFGLDTAISEGDWIKNIILADIYFNEDGDDGDVMTIIRIGYALKKLKELEVTPPFWFFSIYKHSIPEIYVHNLVGPVSKTFKNYKKMMTVIIHFLIRLAKEKNRKFKKPFGFFSDYKSKNKYEFIESISIDSFNRKWKW